MMIRYRLRCRGCDEGFWARVGVDSTRETKFYLLCPNCNLPIRAVARGEDYGTFRVKFDADELGSLADDAKVVTANPFIPARPDADSDSPSEAFPMMTLHHLLGDDVIEFMQSLGSARSAVAHNWQPVRRIYEYYLDGNWQAFDRSIGSSFPSEGWPNGDTVHERATRAHMAILMVAVELVIPSDQLHRYFDRYSRKHTAALRAPMYRTLLVEEVKNGRLADLQRSVFDLIDLFVQRSEMWAMGGLERVVPDERRAFLDDLVLARDEFGELRDLYQQSFELICRTLRFLVAAQNTVTRQGPNDFGSDLPSGVPANRRPANLNQFDKLSAAYRIAYVGQVPGWEGLAAVLDNEIRNTIGHATARHDLRTGRIVSDKNPVGVTYLHFLACVYDLFEALTFELQVLRFARVASSPDF
jgi:hypothetical protein